GRAYARYADFLGEEGDGRASLKMWDESCRAFQRSIDLSPGANVEPLLAFSRRLLSHAERDGGGRVAGGGLGDVAYALSLLDEADEILSDYENPDPQWSEHVIQYRAQALAKLSSEKGRASILDL